MAYLGLQGQNRSQQLNPQSQNLTKNAGQGAQPAGGQTANISSPAAPKADFAKSNFSNSSQIYNRNKNQSQDAFTNRILNPAQQEASQVQENINKQATDYQKAQQEKISGIKALDAGQLASGNQQAQNQYQQLQSAAPVDNFTLQGQTELSKNPYLQQGDISGLMGRQSKRANYSTGMGGLDNLLFNQGGKRQEAQNKLGELQQGIRSNVERLTGNQGLQSQFQGQAEQARKQALESTKKGMGDYLSTLKNTAQTTAAQQAQLRNKQLNERYQNEFKTKKQAEIDRLNNDPAIKAITDRLTTAQHGLTQGYDQYRLQEDQINADRLIKARDQRIANLNKLNPDNFYTSNYALENAINPEQAGQFNRLQELLGGSERWAPKEYTGPTEQFNFDAITNANKNVENPVLVNAAALRNRGRAWA